MSTKQEDWALILGASSGFGLASAKRLARAGMNLFLVHRDRRGAMARIQPQFDALGELGVRVVTANADALDADSRAALIGQIREELGAHGKIRVLMHSIALGNLKLLGPEAAHEAPATDRLADALQTDPTKLAAAANALFEQGEHRLMPLAHPAEYPSTSFLEDADFTRTVHAMGTSLAGWTTALLAQELFADDARVIGLTSEGNTVAWKGYAAVSAAKCALEAVARSLAVELAWCGLRVNILQPGVTDTPALRAIPGHQQLIAQALGRNPCGRLTTPDDVADVVYLLSTPEARWINGALIRVDGGEHVSGLVA